jgi:hypothetical protein
VAVKRASSNVARFKQLCRETAEQLNVSPDDPRVEHVASLKLGRETLTAKLIAGQDDADPAVLLRFDEAIKAYLPQSKPPRIELMKSHGPFSVCPECGWSPPPAEGPINRPGETIRDALVRERLEREAAMPVDSCGVKTHVENNALTASLSPANDPVKTVEPKLKPVAKPEPRPDSVLRDSRPDAPRSLKDGAQSLVWFGVQGSKKEGF